MLNLDPSSYLPKDSLDAFKSYTDYTLCREFMSDLKEQIVSLSNNIELPYRFKCHGKLSLDNIFFDKTNFYFDDFECVFMGHPYIDFTDILLELGISEDIQYKLFSQFCRYGEISEDREFFKKLYEIQLRKN